MSRINTNVASLVAQRVLGQNNQQLNVSLERLSTGLAINRGKDNPAGLIASENLRKDLTGLNAAVNNSERAERVVNIAEGGLTEISNLLTELQGLVTTTANSAGLSDAEKDANQLQVDSILQTIDRISGQTNFQGTKLLNGNFDFKVSGKQSAISDLRVNGAKFNGSSLDVEISVTGSAQRGGVFLSTNAAAFDLAAANSTLVLEVGGSLGTRRFEFSSGTTLTAAANTINTFSDITGVSAVVSGGSGITLQSSEFGSDEFVSVSVVNDGGTTAGVRQFSATGFGTVSGAASSFSSLETSGNPVRDFGQDIGVTINGINAVTNGTTASVDTDFLNVELTIADANANTLQKIGTGATPSFTITGGGANFQIGSNVDINNRVSIGVGDASITRLGSNSAGGFLNDLQGGETANVVDGDTSKSQRIITAAIEQVSSLRGRLGAFQRNTLGANIRSLGVTIENTAAANSVIRDTDFATETASLTRSQILAQAATNSLQLANQQPQTALALLG